MCNIRDQYTRAIHYHRTDNEIERSNRNIKNDREYRCMEERCTSSSVDMRKYSLSTPEIYHVAHSERKERDHSKQYRRYPTPQWEVPQWEECEYHDSDRWEESDYDGHEEHHRNTDEIYTWRAEELFWWGRYIWESIIVFGHSMRWIIERHR